MSTYNKSRGHTVDVLRWDGVLWHRQEACFGVRDERWCERYTEPIAVPVGIQQPAAQVGDTNVSNKKTSITLEHPYLRQLWMSCEASSDLTVRCRARCQRPWLFMKQSSLQSECIRLNQFWLSKQIQAAVSQSSRPTTQPA